MKDNADSDLRLEPLISRFVNHITNTIKVMVVDGKQVAYLDITKVNYF